MKNLILIVFLSFIALSCSKDNTAPQENDNRIKNDIPSELLGKWKEVAHRDVGVNDTVGEWQTSNSDKEYDYYFKEYSICCEDIAIEGQNCDYYSYFALKVNTNPFFTHELFFTICGDELPSTFKRFFKIVKGNELIIHFVGLDDYEETKYVKVE